MSSSGSWPSECPEKYPWIEGEERIPPWWEQEMQDHAEASSALRGSDQENCLPLQEIPRVIPPPPEDPRIHQLEEIAMELTARLFAAEAEAQRKGEEGDRPGERAQRRAGRPFGKHLFPCLHLLG